MKGTIYTFYSYKGGVGRSMALANIGMHFYRQGYKTLLIDWDLEAPGLERYFEAKFKINMDDVADRAGLCDMLNAYIANVSNSAFEDNAELPYPRVEEYLYQIDQNGDNKLLLLPAGRRTEGQPWQDYATFVQTFDWSSFYKEWEGGIYLEWLREKLKTLADIILIDSRTGITEMGGVATQHLSDIVILLFGANLENISNTSRMAKNFISSSVEKARGNRPLDVFVVPSRIDDADSEGYKQFLLRIENSFTEIYMRVLNEGFSIEEMIIPYLTVFSYSEALIIDVPELEKTAQRITEAYRRIASNMKALAPSDSSLKLKDTSLAKFDKPNVFLAYVRDDHSIAADIKANLISRDILVQETSSRRNVEMEEQISNYQCIIVILSKSANESPSIKRVIHQATSLHKPIVPILTDESEIPYSLYDRVYIDFRSNFNTSMKKLIEAIKPSAANKDIINAHPKISNKMIYISYSRKDARTAEMISDFLNKNSFHIWLDIAQIRAGERWDNAIERALTNADCMLVLLSSLSVESSSVLDEVSYMMERGKPVIPILLDLEHATIPFRLRRMQMIDLTQNQQTGLNELKNTLHKIL